MIPRVKNAGNIVPQNSFIFKSATVWTFSNSVRRCPNKVQSSVKMENNAAPFSWSVPRDFQLACCVHAVTVALDRSLGMETDVGVARAIGAQKGVGTEVGGGERAGS